MALRTFWLSLLFLGILQISQSQDIIVLANRAKIEAKDIVVKGKVITYQDYSDVSGKQFTIAFDKVEYIQYANGEKLLVSDLESKINNDNPLGDNLISFHVLDFAINSFTLSYERILKNGKFSLQIPISFGYGDSPADIMLPPPFDSEIETYFANRFSTGLNFNIYPTQQGTVRYFFGPSILFGTGKHFEQYDYYNEHQTPSVSTGYISFIVNNGLMVTPISHLSLALVGSIGARQFFNVEDGKTATVLKLSFNLSYRF